MFNALLTAVLTALLTVMGFVLVGFVVYRKIKTASEQLIQDVFIAKTEGEQSQFGQFLKTVTDTAAKSIVVNLKMSLLGGRSVEKKMENALMNDVVQEGLAGGNPIVGAVLEMMPKAWKAKIAKNPVYGMVAQTVIDKVVGGNKSPIQASAPLQSAPGGGDYAQRLSSFGGG